jgi:hypothetical protein
MRCFRTSPVRSGSGSCGQALECVPLGGCAVTRRELCCRCYMTGVGGLFFLRLRKGSAMTRRRTLYLPALLVAAVLACVAALATLLAVSREAESTFPGKNGKIAFVSTRDTKRKAGISTP